MSWYPTPVSKLVLGVVAVALTWAVLSLHGLAPYTHDLVAGPHHAVGVEHAGGGDQGHAGGGHQGGEHDGGGHDGGGSHDGGHGLAHLALCCLLVLGGGLFLLRLRRLRAWVARVVWPALAVLATTARSPDPLSLAELSVLRT